MAKHLKSTGSMFDWAAIKAGIFNSVLNAGIGFLVSFGAKLASDVWDELNTTVEEQKQKVDELQASYEGLQSEYDTLSKKQEVTKEEKERLEYLKARLELDKQILEAEKLNTFREVSGNKFTDWFDKDNDNTQYRKELNVFNKEGYQNQKNNYNANVGDLEYVQEQIASLEKQKELYKDMPDVIENINISLGKLRNSERDILDSLEVQGSQLLINLGEYDEKIKYYESILNNENATSSDKDIAREQISKWQELYDWTKGAITNIQKLNGTFQETTDVVEDVKDGVNETAVLSFEEQITQIHDLSEGLDQLDEIMADVMNGESFDYSSILGNDDFKNAFGKYTEEYENFIQSITNSPDDISKCKDAFNDLATAYIYGSGALSNLTEESKDAAILDLEQMGISNSAEIVENALNKYSEALRIAEVESIDLANATLADIESLMKSEHAIDGSAESLFYYALQKELVSENGISTGDECQQLINLANQAFETGEVLTKLVNIFNVLNGTKNVSWGERTKKLAMEELKNMLADFGKMEVKDYSGGSKTKETKEKAKKSAKETADTYLEEFEKELDALKLLQKSGLINESEYLSRLKRLYNRYFADRKEYLDEFQKYEREYLEGMESLYNSAISAVVKLKDKKIDSAKESKESVIENLEAEKDASDEAYQAQIDAIKNLTDEKERHIEGIKAEIDSIQGVIDGYNEQIDLINAEIKAKKEANEERKRSMQLQEDEYNLQSALNQRKELALVDNQFIYRPNEEGIRDAREKVADSKFEIEIAEKEKEISRIEELIKQKEKEIEQKEKSISLIEKEIDVLDKQAESIQKAQEESEKYYDNLIKQQENYYNSLIENLEKEKSKWEELAEIKEVADAYSAIEQVFGDLGYTVDDVLSNSAGVFEDFKAKYIDLLNTMNSNDSFGNGLSYAVDELDKSLANVGTNTEGLDNLVSKMDEVTTSVGNVSNAINGSGMSSMASGEDGSVTGTGSSLKDAIADQTNDALTKLEEQSNAFSNGEDSLEGSVQNVIDKVAGSSEGKDKKDSKEGESEADTDNLIGAIQAQYDKTVETIPQQIESFNLFESAIGGCVTQLHAMIEALKEVQTLSSSIGMMGTVPINGYATGTTHAKKGLAVLAEDEKPELLEDTKGNLSLVTEPTLVNMKGGEKVYNGEETKSLLKGNKIYDAWVEYKTKYANNPALLSASIMKTSPNLFTANQDIWNRQMDYLTSKDKVAPRVENKSNSYSVGDVHIHCSGITSKDVAEEASRQIKREFFGMSGQAQQIASITR